VRLTEAGHYLVAPSIRSGRGNGTLDRLHASCPPCLLPRRALQYALTRSTGLLPSQQA